MPAGKLRERLLFQSPMSGDDGYGNTVDGWQDEKAIWAEVRPIKGGGGEQVLGQRLSGVQPVIISVRYSRFSRGIASDWRAIDTRTETLYQVKSPPTDMDGRREYLDMLAESGVAA